MIVCGFFLAGLFSFYCYWFGCDGVAAYLTFFLRRAARMKMNGMKGALKRVSPCTASTSASDPAMMMKRRRVMLSVESCFSASL